MPLQPIYSTSSQSLAQENGGNNNGHPGTTVLPNVFLFEDTCNVYVVRSGNTAVLIDFGSGDVLDHLASIGVERVTDVLITHHHRDQAQGLNRAVESGIRIWVPHTEQDLFQSVDTHWQSRELFNNYNMRQDRFSLLEPVAIDGTLQDYEARRFGDHIYTVVPTPGHTIGSITLLTDVDGQRVAFSGDLIAGPGKVWNMSTTQWSYNGAEGVAASILSLLDLKDRQPDHLLPSHGAPMNNPAEAIDLLVARFWQLLQLRGQYRRLLEWRDRPFDIITPHLLHNRTSTANSYVLLSDSRKALILDFGYDFFVGAASGSDRASRRPWLYSVPMLKQQFDVEAIEAVIPTHFHDDHVAGLNLLRDVEGAEVWVADSFSDILTTPAGYDLPCLWYDPIPVDRVLPVGQPVQWQEYTLTLYPLPGHTLYAVAISLEVDGKRVLVTGDQYQGQEGLELNYVYQNRFHAGDYRLSADLYDELEPDLILSGHWQPLWVTPDYLTKIQSMGTELEQLHYDLLPQSVQVGEEGFLAKLYPYQATVEEGQTIQYHVEVRNPFAHPAEAAIRMVLPEGWQVVGPGSPKSENIPDEDGSVTFTMKPLATEPVSFRVAPPANFTGRRVRVSVDVTIDGHRFGQQAEALVSSAQRRPRRARVPA